QVVGELLPAVLVALNGVVEEAQGVGDLGVLCRLEDLAKTATRDGAVSPDGKRHRYAADPTGPDAFEDGFGQVDVVPPARLTFVAEVHRLVLARADEPDLVEEGLVVRLVAQPHDVQRRLSPLGEVKFRARWEAQGEQQGLPLPREALVGRIPG